MTLGILLDAFVVRSVLVPGPMTLAGRPGRHRRGARHSVASAPPAVRLEAAAVTAGPPSALPLVAVTAGPRGGR